MRGHDDIRRGARFGSQGHGLFEFFPPAEVTFAFDGNVQLFAFNGAFAHQHFGCQCNGVHAVTVRFVRPAGPNGDGNVFSQRSGAGENKRCRGKDFTQISHFRSPDLWLVRDVSTRVRN